MANNLEKTWLVMCPDWRNAKHLNKPHGWALFRRVIEKIGNDYLSPAIECIVCGKKFSLLQGVNEAFCSDIVIDEFRHNSRENGQVEVTVGELLKINFAEPFLDVPVINLTPYLKPVAAVAGYVTPKGFAIFSCADVCFVGEKRQIGWSASGNRASTLIPLWRSLLSIGKDHQKSKNFRSEIVELESAFEVFVGEYLATSLKVKLRQETISWVLKRSIEEQLNVGFAELFGSSLAKIHPVEYSKWVELVKERRDSIVHRGLPVTEEHARNARSALIDIIVNIDNSALNHFQVQMKNIGSDGPCASFGTATIKGKQV